MDRPEGPYISKVYTDLRDPSNQSGLSSLSLGIDSRTSSSSSIKSAGSSPSIGDAQAELIVNFGSEDLKRKTLTCNFKMVLGITLGVLVGLVVLSVALGGIVASHGALGAVLGIVALKLTAGTSAAGSAIAGGAMGAWIGKIISAVVVGVVFLGGGKIAGDLFRKGEIQQLDNLLVQSSSGITDIEAQCGHPVSEEELQNHIEDLESRVLSSQSGRNFVQAARSASLNYYIGFAPAWNIAKETSGTFQKCVELAKVIFKNLGPLFKAIFKSLVPLLKASPKAFGHFWLMVPTTSLKSITDRKQYDLFNKHLLDEKYYKRMSAKKNLFEKTRHNNLKKLNEMRAIQVDRLLARSGAMGVAYSKAPEIQIFDRNIAKLECLKAKFPDNAEMIDLRIGVEKEKKALLIAKRLEGTPALDNIVSKDPVAPVKSLLSIVSDIKKLPNNEEHQGQILEAVTILLRMNPKMTIDNVNALVQNLSMGLISRFKKSSDNGRQISNWRTRESVNEYAKKFSEHTRKSGSEIPSVVLKFSKEGAPMTSKVSGRYALRALDVAISCIHMLPFPGSSEVAAGLTGIAVIKEKRGG